MATLLQSILTFLFFYQILSLANAATTYDVVKLGARGDGTTDSAQAFLAAWSAACRSIGPATIYVPAGRYLVGSAVFSGGQCRNNAITFSIIGTLVAPTNYESETWIVFREVNGVTISGGVLDGQGTGLWACKNSGKSCPLGATSLLFGNSRNVLINAISSINSQMFHIVINGCNNVILQGVRVSADGNSPNTDGIHVSMSTGVTINRSLIGTGDDCISIGPGATNLWIQDVKCGPGHGISIGSLGKNINENGVQNVTVTSTHFSGTQNGVRIKTWATSNGGFVRDVTFQHVTMDNVNNPVIIDQNYCPDHKNCPDQESAVKISRITYQDIHGTSATPVGVKLECSKKYPCSGLILDGVKITYKSQPVKAECSNAVGSANGVNGCF